MLTVNKKSLQKAISVVERALPKKVVIPERAHILCTASKEGKLWLRGTNNELKASCVLDLKDPPVKDESFTVDPKMLSSLVAKIDLDDISMFFDPEELTVTVYTTLDNQSFTTLQSFPTKRVLNVEGPDKPFDFSTPIKTEVLKRALDFAAVYMDMKEENKQYDFLIMNHGVAFASNGLNKAGYFVTNEFRPFENLRIRKAAIPPLVSVLSNIDADEISIGEQDSNVAIQTLDKSVYFGMLKASIDPPKVNLDRLKKEGAYLEINRTEFVKKLKRLTVTMKNMPLIGVELTLSGAGSSASLGLSLMHNLKAKETISCTRIDDPSTDTVTHLLDLNSLQKQLTSFSGKVCNFYFEERSAKIYEGVKDDKTGLKYITVGVTSYLRVAKG